jgi:DNA polymerase-3 subunit delta'
MSHPWLEPVRKEFAERLDAGRLPHALLLSGPVDIGKTNLATELVAGLLCLEQSLPACGQCRSCRLLESGAHPDRHRITFEEHPKTGDLRKEIVIDQIRRLIASLTLTTTVSPRKAALIHPVEAMNRNAANALLKTLEEPPGDTVLILVSHDPARLPATIRSRCQKLNVRLPDREQSLAWLQGEAGASVVDAELALNAAAGSPLGALRMLQEGQAESYRAAIQTLDDLLDGRINAGQAMAGLSELDPSLLWPWLSLRAAENVRAAAAEQRPTKALVTLQRAADQNRRLLPTPVRKDLLLQDWLIQWARLKA